MKDQTGTQDKGPDQAAAPSKNPSIPTSESSSDSQTHESHRPTRHHSKPQPRYRGVLGEYQRVQERKNDVDQLDRAIGSLNQSANATCYKMLLLIRQFDERSGWKDRGFSDGVAWLKWRCDLGTGTAREKLRISHALKHLPLISKTFSEGRLSYSKVRVITRIATAENESELIGLAKHMTVRHLTEHCKQRANASSRSKEGARQALEQRSYRVWRDNPNDTMHFSIELPMEDGDLLEKAIDKAAIQLNGESKLPYGSAEKEGSWSTVQADAVIKIARLFLTDAAGNSHNPAHKLARSIADHYQVVVHVDEQALANSGIDPVEHPFTETVNQLAPMSFTSPLNNDQNKTKSQYPVEVVRRLCCDGSIVPILESAEGEPLQVGKKFRTITTGVRRALWARDKGCCFPGCDHTRFVDAHHVKHWVDGGESTIDNLALLCSRHHKLVHEGSFTIEPGAKGRWTFRRPDGQTIMPIGFDFGTDDYNATESVIDEDSNKSSDGNVHKSSAQENSREFSEYGSESSSGHDSNRVREARGRFNFH